MSIMNMRHRLPSRISARCHLSLITLSLVAGLSAAHHGAAQTPVECQLEVSLDYQKIPADVCPQVQFEPPLRYFDALAWQSFKMLVWPAAPVGRGHADEHKTITDSGKPTFETYKADWETFLPLAATPAAWDSYAIRHNPCRNNPMIAAGELVLASQSEFGNVIEGDPNGLANVLVAQNGTYVRYLAAYGESAFSGILDNRLYDPNTLSTMPGYLPPGSHAPGTSWTIPDKAAAPTGAMTVKSAWVEVPESAGKPSPIDPPRFHVTEAWLQDPATGACRIARVALVALHFVHKTPRRPQWVWSTFEHIDNVPEQADPPGKTYTFNDGNGASMPQTPPPAYLMPGAATGAANPPAPINIERHQRIETETDLVNQAWQKALGKVGSVWQYYKLVMTQWPLLYNNPDRDGFAAVPVPPCGPVSPDSATANVVLETFFQEASACRDNSRKTCVGCHNAARTSDFIWSIPLNVNIPATMQGKPSPRTVGLQTLQSIVGRNAAQ
jgi:hypothetical protein